MTDLNLDDVAKDATSNDIPREESMRKLAELAAKQIALEDWIKTSEERVAKQKERLKNISEMLIPELMHNLGVTTFTLSSGMKVEVKPWFSLKIPGTSEDNPDPEATKRAYDWLEEHGHGEIVKHSLTVETRMTQDKLLDQIRAVAERLKLDVKDKLGIHHMTGSAWAKRELAKPIPIGSNQAPIPRNTRDNQRL